MEELNSRRQRRAGCRALAANTFALIGRLAEAHDLAKQDVRASSPLTRSQAESALSVVQRRLGNLDAALNHAEAAIQLAIEAKHAERIAWAQLYRFRFFVEGGQIN